MKTKYAYPAQFVNEDNGTVSVFFPDLDGCSTYDNTLNGAAIMAKEALELYIEVLLDAGKALPEPSSIDNAQLSDSDIKEIARRNGCKTMLVVADVENIKSQTRYVKKTLSIPYWLDVAAKERHINFSGVLQEALKERLV
jgi:predicted RNase H-like HicB family nuclease